MKIASRLLYVTLGLLLLVSVAVADDLATFSGAISFTDPTQLGRLSRSGIPSSWAGPKTFPGVINLGTTYYYGTDPISFQIYVPTGDELVLVINNTASGGVGVGDPYTIYVQGYLDSEYTSTPEPSSLLLLGSGVLGLAGLVRRKFLS